MADIRDQIKSSAPTVQELDVVSLRARAAEVRASDQRRRRSIFAGVTATLCLLLVGVVVTITGRAATDQVAVAPPPTDGGVDAISGPALSGGELGIADFEGEPLIVFGWAPWCGPCIATELSILAGAIDDLDVQVVGLAVGAEGDAARALEALDAAGLELPSILLDQAQLDAVLPSGPAGGVPVWMGLNAEHEIVDTVLGSIGGELRLRTMADRARTRTEPDPHVTVVATPQLPIEDRTGPVPTIAPHAPATPSMDSGCTPGDRTHIVQAGDTLSTIAEAVYGDPLMFGPIAEANGLDGSTPVQVGDALDIPDCGIGGTAPPPEGRTTSAIDADVQQAIVDSAPEGWQPRPTDVTDGLAYVGADGGIMVRQLELDGTTTAEAVIEEAIAAGAGRVALPDGASAAFTNPAATGHLLVPLPGGRVLQIAGEGSLADTLDYEIGTLQQWMGTVRSHLGA